MLITEIFASVQGEGLRAGLPTVFVRLARCPYRCRWCDSAYTFTGGDARTVEEVVEAVCNYGEVPNVCITGGEPLAQRRAVEELSARLLVDCPWLRSVEIETSGGLAIWRADDPRLHWDMDIKCPGSGMVDHFLPANIDRLGAGDEIKFVLADKSDFDFARSFVRDRLRDTPAGIFFQPAWNLLDPATLVQWLLTNPRPDVRLSLQQHKYIWGAETRGV